MHSTVIQRQLAVVFGVLLASAACSEPQVPGGEITFQNDILDKEYNSFRIDEVITGAGLSGFSRTLTPGGRVTIPLKHISSLRVTRQYKDHAKVYVVECPADFDRKVVIKLIDVHTNRIKGGCVLAKKGERRSGSIQWEKD